MGSAELRNYERELAQFQLRIAVAGFAVLAAFLLLAGRFFFLQVVHHDVYRAKAEENRIAIVPVAPNRGLIVDRNGAVIARNYSGYTLEIYPRRVESLEHTIDELAELEPRWGDAAAGGTLVHGDIRADNILLTAERVVFVDWPHACVGAAWLDLLLLLPSVAMQGGPPPWEVFETHRFGRDAPSDAVMPVVAALAGFFVHRSTLPPPPGLSTLREFQRGQGIEALAWLRHGLDES